MFVAIEAAMKNRFKRMSCAGQGIRSLRSLALSFFSSEGGQRSLYTPSAIKIGLSEAKPYTIPAANQHAIIANPTWANHDLAMVSWVSLSCVLGRRGCLGDTRKLLTCSFSG